MTDEQLEILMFNNKFSKKEIDLLKKVANEEGISLLREVMLLGQSKRFYRCIFIVLLSVIISLVFSFPSNGDILDGVVVFSFFAIVILFSCYLSSFKLIFKSFFLIKKIN
jgi:uncharacterized membrane protein YjjP (DUF1212 family)